MAIPGLTLHIQEIGVYVEIPDGMGIFEAISQSKQLAAERRCAVLFRFRGIPVEVNENTDEERATKIFAEQHFPEPT
jgi:hypothetical protein